MVDFLQVGPDYPEPDSILWYLGATKGNRWLTVDQTVDLLGILPGVDQMNRSGANAQSSAIGNVINAGTSDLDAGNALNVQPALISRSLSTRFLERYSAKDWMLGDGVASVSSIQSYFTALNATYPHGTSPNIVAASRVSYFPGGIYRNDPVTAGSFVVGQIYTILTVGTTNYTLIGAGTNTVGEFFTATGAGTGNGTAFLTIGTGGYGEMIRGDGNVSQLSNINIQLNHNRASLQDLRLISAGSGVNFGIGIDIRAGLNYIRNVDVMNKAIGINNTTSFTVGGGANSCYIDGGWIRDCDVAVRNTSNDFRMYNLRASNSTPGARGLEINNGAGQYISGCNMSITGGPSFIMSGKLFPFNGDTEAAGFVIENVSIDDISFISVGDELGSSSMQLLPNTRVIGKTATTVTVDRAFPDTVVDAAFSINRIPNELFLVGNTFNSSPIVNTRTYNIVSVVSANGGASVLVTFDDEHELSLGFGRVGLSNTGNATYDEPEYRGTIEAIPTSSSIQISITYVADVSTGTVTLSDFDGWFQSEPPSNATVRSIFMLGNNINSTLFEGVANIGAIGTRLKTSMYMRGSQPFLADTVSGDPQITNMSMPTTQVRKGQYLINAANLTKNCKIISIDSINSVTLDKDAIGTATQVNITSPQQSSNLFHIISPDDQFAGGAGDFPASATLRNTDPMFSGSGSLLGWGQFGLIRTGIAAYNAVRGSYELGARVPYTDGGLLNNQPAFLNTYGAMNTGIRLRSNGQQYDMQGAEWSIRDPRTWVITNLADGGDILTAGAFTTGLTYKIVTVGSTDYTLIGASANTVGIVFIATGAGAGTGTAREDPRTVVTVSTNIPLINGTYVRLNGPSRTAGAFIIGAQYLITSIGTTDFTLIGAVSNTIGVRFTATGVGSGSGTALSSTISIVTNNPRFDRTTIAAPVVDAPTQVAIFGARIALRGGLLNAGGTAQATRGEDFNFELRAYRGDAVGTDDNYGNSIITLRAPNSSSLVGTTSLGGGFIVHPGNPIDGTVHTMIGATTTAFNLNGTYLDIQKNSTNVVDIRGLPRVSGFALGVEYFRLSGEAANTDSFVSASRVGVTRFRVDNINAGTAAYSELAVRNQANNDSALMFRALGQSFTTANYLVQDGSAIIAGPDLSGGLSVVALAGGMRFYVGNTPSMTITAVTGNITVQEAFTVSNAVVAVPNIPTVDPGIPGRMYRTAGSLMVSI